MSFQTTESEIRKINRETSDVYLEHVRPGDNVVVVGPSTSIYNDTTLLLVTHILSNQGKAYVVDPQVSGDKMDWKKVSERSKGFVTGAGGIDRHLDELRAIKKIGLQLTLPKWLGKKSSAQWLNLQDSSCDVVGDHNTALFIAGLRGDNEDQRWQRAIDVFREYTRVLKTGGTLLFQTNHQYNFGGERTLEELLLSVGIASVRQTVDDVVRIPISAEVQKKITFRDESSLPKVKSNPYLYDYLASIIRQKGPNYFLLFDKPQRSSDDSIQYWCPDFYVGKKL